MPLLHIHKYYSACCETSILRVSSCQVLYFCTFLLKPHFDLEPDYIEPDYIVRKPIKRHFQQYLVRTEILPIFHTRVEYTYRGTIRHSAHSNEWGANAKKILETAPSP